MAKEAKVFIPGSSVEDKTPKASVSVELAIARLASASEWLQACRMAERTARTSGDPEAMDDAVYDRLKAEKEFRQATAEEAKARAARAAQRRLR